MNRIILLIIILLFNPCLADAQTDRQALAAKDTRQGYDLRGAGFDSAMNFIALHYHQFPVIIGVSSQNKELIDAIIQILRELDNQGLEDIVLLLHDAEPKAKTNGQIHCITFYKKGELASSLAKHKYWGLVEVQNSAKTAITLNQGENGYPLTLIQTKIKTTHNNSGAHDYSKTTYD